MHDTAYRIGSAVLQSYAPAPGLVIEIGAADVNGSLRTAAEPGITYIGVDIAPAPGVDVVRAEASPIPIRSGVADLVIATSAFEHDECFWETFLEACRLTRIGGCVYLNAPSNGKVHRHPLDCWRFYPDAGLALARYSRRSDWPVTLVESFIARQGRDGWNDFVGIFARGALDANRPRLNAVIECDHVRTEAPITDQDGLTEDMRNIRAMGERITQLERIKALYEAILSMGSSSFHALGPLASKISGSPYRASPELPQGFDPVTYLATSEDLFLAGVDPYEHYLQLGQHQNRRW